MERVNYRKEREKERDSTIKNMNTFIPSNETYIEPDRLTFSKNPEHYRAKIRDYDPSGP